jgi:hypothetical protein
MIHLILAVVLANPCLAPVHHKHHTSTPAQTCVVPTVPMCFKDPVPDPTEVVLPPLPYYFEQPADDGTQGEGPYIETTAYSLSTGGEFIGYSQSNRYVPPTHGYAVPHQTPEVSAVGTMPALVLLLGGIAVIRGRKA